MGFEQVKAAGMYANGQEGTLVFESFPNQAEVITYSADSSVTDSAAAATAIATGAKVNNGVISMAIPGDSSELYTLLEYFRDMGKSTGLVTTSFLTDATPAAFGAHVTSRNLWSEIDSDYLWQTRANILFGGGAHGMTIAEAESAGYTVVIDSAGMWNLNTDTVDMISGQFGNNRLPFEYDYFLGTDNGYDTLPHLSEMTITALNILDNNPNGFFLMVEGGRIDHAGHQNWIGHNIFETLEFENAVQIAVNWSQGRPDTLILVTADHETGGLAILQNNGQGVFPDVSWTTSDHTAANVPIFAWGVNAYKVSGIMDNTAIFEVATCSTPSVKVFGDPNGYSSIQSAYDSAEEGDTIYSRTAVITQNLNINRNISVRLEGGYNCNYDGITGKTTLNGILTISNGTATIENFMVQ